MDLTDQLRRLEHVYQRKPKCRALDSRMGQGAKKSLDLLQLLIDHPNLSNRLRTKICSTMLHISKKTGFHPKCLAIENVEVVGKNPIDGGGYADIWKGRLGQSLVCLKILRIFKEPEVQQVLKLNVLITPDLRACISDFGLSIVAESSLRFSNTSSAFSGGTTRYQAPEVVRFEVSKPTRESDVYSYGCVAYEVKRDVAVGPRILMGARPERPTDITNLQLSDELWTLVIEQCWKTEPPERPSAGDLRARLLEIESTGFRGIPSTTQNGSEISRELWEQVYRPHLPGADIDTFIATLEMTEAFNEKSMLRRGSVDEFDDGAYETFGSLTSGFSTPTTPARANVPSNLDGKQTSGAEEPPAPSLSPSHKRKQRQSRRGSAKADAGGAGGAHNPRNVSPLGEIDLPYTPPPSISGSADRDRPRRRSIVIEEEEEDRPQSHFPTPRFGLQPLPTTPPASGIDTRAYMTDRAPSREDDFPSSLFGVPSKENPSRDKAFSDVYLKNVKVHHSLVILTHFLGGAQLMPAYAVSPRIHMPVLQGPNTAPLPLLEFQDTTGRRLAPSICHSMALITRAIPPWNHVSYAIPPTLH
ncbi:Rho guanine nucleotide exchange factor [Marasmius tenuissimus]|uniref:Rho guanine nucleotide exchange factor n=1 Tax=Marasmius tenuissimus TaxID=585030 RepID=A0ABR2ZBY9_9AGAR